jgi:hypothetical protein
MPEDLDNLNPRIARALARDPRLSRFLRERVAEFWRTSVGGTLEGIPRYQASAWLGEKVHEKITLRGSLDYVRLEDRSLARTWGAGVAWSAGRSLEIRAGSLWDRQAGSTSRSTTLGATWVF